MEQIKFIMLGILMGFFIIAAIDPAIVQQAQQGQLYYDDSVDSSQPVDEKFGGGVKSYRDPGNIIYDPSEDGPGGN
jgi:hypothetical protein